MFFCFVWYAICGYVMKYFWSRFKFLKFKDFLSIFVLILVFLPAMVTKIFVRDLWLICEDKNEARDNGYWLFKYIREKYPKQKCYYAINKKCVDYNKVKGIGKIISFGGFSHWFWYLVADKNISSQKNGKPSPALCYLLEVTFGFRKKNRYFLQHGITINDVEFLHYKNTKMYRFCTSTVDEHNFVCDNFGYKKEQVVLTGLARFDNLNNHILDKKLILCMPTWRNWIAREVECEKYEGTKEFTKTNYFKAWSEFLVSTKLEKYLEDNDLTMIFYPHRNMQKYIDNFHINSKRIIVANAKEYDVQDLLKKSALLITDYSSVFFDFAYLGKPIIFYQFDEKKFRQGQYKKGYFDYKTSELAYWTDNLDGVVNLLHEHADKIGTIDTETPKKYFKYIDTNNCERIYQMIKGKIN